MAMSLIMLKMGISFGIVTVLFMLYDLVMHTGSDKPKPSGFFMIVFGGLIALVMLCLASAGILILWGF